MEDDLLKALAKDFLEGTGSKPKQKVVFTHEKHEIVEIIEHLEEKLGLNVPEEDIIQKAKEHGISEEETRNIIDELVRDGFLYRPHYMTGIVRVHGVSDYTQWSHDFPV